MRVQFNPYLGFRDAAREAMAFYQSVFGGELKIQTFKDLGMETAAGDEDKIMHSVLEAEDVVIMGADVPSHVEYRLGSSMSLSLSGGDEARLAAYHEKLSAGGTETVPLETAPWGDKFGMFTDKFGIDWMVNIALPKKA